MSKKTILERRQGINQDIRDCIDKTLKDSTGFLQHNFRHLNISDYKYDPSEAIDELGLDLELLNQLVEDYVIQILKSKLQFFKYLEDLKTARKKSKKLNYISFRELAHKNLGVARNLRIKDATKVLDELMKKDDLEYLSKCIVALESCAIRLKPKCAYETLKLMKVKNSL